MPLRTRSSTHFPSSKSELSLPKDSDFVDSFLTVQQPYKLLLVTTGNIKNSELETLFAANLSLIVDLLSQNNYIELSRDSVIVHQ